MNWNRNHYFFFGFALLLFGGQLRLVDSFVLNEGSTRFLARQAAAQAEPLSLQAMPLALAGRGALPVQRKTVRPPRWLSWSLMSIGAVLVLHGLALPKPGGGEH